MEILVDFMQEHPRFAKNIAHDADRLWQILTESLNKIGGVSKLERAWKKVIKFVN